MSLGIIQSKSKTIMIKMVSKDGWMDGWIIGWICGWMNRRMDGWMDIYQVTAS